MNCTCKRCRGFLVWDTLVGMPGMECMRCINCGYYVHINKIEKKGSRKAPREELCTQLGN